MRFKILTLLILLLLFFGCQKNEKNKEAETIKQNNTQGISEKDIKDLDYIEYALDQKTDTIIQDWSEYIQIHDLVNNVKVGDLSFFNDNEKAIKLLLKELKTKIP